ncbi:S9 family peptidase [Actinoalloteichus hymeniacidonis]|uniref:Dipeptidyl aminopeptidase/acylaminoacyl peptidase n=1 Tax=Actinoalloteichus hymeniacidonis TaxID=340345 RepID=A0AAC9HLM5_9PSEU|nr:DPP IV N-terminal domain-containing protein [Actinoalloteichus hymeniacidonis]AOS61567.1 dipeptidyl aminopeptidase/acylaminoacyl peptidase [Actinoalloteichus hymeniacidonis]MBB5910424.1 dipeptidyl aminopeptidase/acylaminoacyl peptidase [Actinoalloteichus hymeniacidonis]
MTTDLETRYANAEALLPHHLKALVTHAQVQPTWIRDTATFWYRIQTAAGKEFVVVDAEARTKEPAFDHERMATALGRILDATYRATDLPFHGIELFDDAVEVVVGEQRIRVSTDDYEATILGPTHPSETRSPDGRWSVGVRDHNLYLRDTTTDEERQLTTDGAEGYAYAGMNDAVANRVMEENLGVTFPPHVVWSPDSSRFVTHRLDQREVELMHLVRSSPQDGGRPRLMSYHYPLVGDEKVATAEFFVFDAATGESTKSTCAPIDTPFVPTIAYGFMWWSEDSSTIHFAWGDRGDKTVRVHELDPDTGDVTVLVAESSETNVLIAPYHHERNIRVLASGEVLLWSERSGWGHLYLHRPDGSTVTVTSGDWLVRKIVSVDEQARRVTFTAAGREPGSDIHLQELYSVSLDGGEITTITTDGLDHETRPSPSGRFFVDVMSRVDVPAVSVLRNGAGEVVLELEQADATALYAAGWTPPERVMVKSADGVTDIQCAIYKPHDFDPSKSYPVLDEIYAGVQVTTTPRRFPQSGGFISAEVSGAVFAALGFVVVAIDARGTALRHKAFQDHARLVGEGQFVADHVEAIKQLAETRPWMDLDRVGIFGESGGGYGSTRAMLQAPDFFKVAVSSSGDHDDAMYHAWWGEKFFGDPDEYDYAKHSNMSLVDNLRGKLLLVHGEMDDNVTPHLTMRLVDALIQANKNFDLLIMPNADHAMLVNQAYWLRRRWDYFVEHLMGETPPVYRIADIELDPDMLASIGG